MGLFDNFNKDALLRKSKGYDMFFPKDLGLVDPGARPEYASATNLLNPQGLLKEQYRVTDQGDISDAGIRGVNLDTSALQKLRERGLATGMSDVGRYLTEAQGLEEKGALGKAIASNRQAGSSAFSDLASRGGISAGARERLAMQGGRSLNQSLQDVRNQGMLQRLGILSDDEARKQGILSQLPGQEGAAFQSQLGQQLNLADLAGKNRDYSTGIERENIQGSLAEVGRQDADRLAKYQEQMRSYAAAQQANAILKSSANSGGGGKGGPPGVGGK